ncbi:MAG: ABC transporter permease [Candidatus Leucobacter sulfamidivorax]|nr:ABC transporter permease [Candidatus Leucobacter sulfamidivorax]
MSAEDLAGSIARPRTAGTGRALLLAERFALPAIMVVTAVVFWVTQPAFGTSANIQAILSSQSVILVLAMGMIVPLIAGNFDLSIGSIASLSSIVAAKLMVEQGVPVLLALALGLVCAMAIGAFNGYLVAYANLDALIATLGSSIVMTGIISWITNDLAVTGIPSGITRLAITPVLGVPILVLLALLAAAVVAYLTAQTPFGRRLTAIGSNRNAADLVGIGVRRLQLVSFVISGFFGGIAGIMLLAQQGSGSPAVNPISLILPALAALFLGASAITPGQFNVLGTLIGLTLVSVLVSGLILAGANTWVQSIVTGGALILAVATSTALRRRRLGMR